MIYETVPEEQKRGYGDKVLLLNYLMQNKGTFFSARSLARQFGYRETGTQVELRQTLTEAISGGYPIVSSANGYTYATNKRQILFYINKLQERNNGLNRRINALRRILDDN